MVSSSLRRPPFAGRASGSALHARSDIATLPHQPDEGRTGEGKGWATRMTQVAGLFPIPLMTCKRILDGEMTRKVVADVLTSTRETNVKSDLLSHTEMLNPNAKGSYLRTIKVITPRLAEFGALLFGETLEWSVKEMWVNVMESGGHQALHNHANSFVSGVIYLTPSHPSASTVFHRAIGGHDYVFNNDNKDSATGPFNGRKWVMPDVDAGDMILFPSYMLHEVPRNQGDQRITLAFNAIPNRLNSCGYRIRLLK